MKRKASFREAREVQAKRFCLEPPVNSDDTTMAEYQQRVARDNLTMMSPFKNVWKKTREKVNAIEEKVSRHSKQKDTRGASY